MKVLTDTPTQVASIHAPAWYAAIAAWEPWVRAATDSPETVRLRTYHVARAGRDIPADPLTVTANQLVDWLVDNDWSANTRRSYRSSLRGFFGWLHAQGKREDNPGALIPRTPPARSKPRPAPTAVIETALDMTRTKPKVYLAIRLGADCALRRAEIAGVHSDHVERIDGDWWLRVVGKGGHERMVPLPDDLALALRARGGWLFPNRDHPDQHVTPWWVGKQIGRALAAATEVGHYSTHTLRHAAATNAYAATGDLLAVQQFLGHVSPETTQVYTLIPEQQIRAAQSGASQRRH